MSEQVALHARGAPVSTDETDVEHEGQDGEESFAKRARRGILVRNERLAKIKAASEKKADDQEKRSGLLINALTNQAALVEQRLEPGWLSPQEKASKEANKGTAAFATAIAESMVNASANLQSGLMAIAGKTPTQFNSEFEVQGEETTASFFSRIPQFNRFDVFLESNGGKIPDGTPVVDFIGYLDTEMKDDECVVAQWAGKFPSLSPIRSAWRTLKKKLRFEVPH